MIELITDLAAPGVLSVSAPLMHLQYSETIKLAKRLGIPLEFTRTCIGPEAQACGRCDPCRAREQAFIEARVSDPLQREVVTAR